VAQVKSLPLARTGGPKPRHEQNSREISVKFPVNVEIAHWRSAHWNRSSAGSRNRCRRD
jgi:hypothetical protein